MHSAPSEAVLVGRLKSGLDALLARVDDALSHLDKAEEHIPLLLHADEARTLCECLLRLNLKEDCRRFVRAWRPLQSWCDGKTGELFAVAFEDDPDREHWREVYGFPSVEELAISVQERRSRDARAVLLLREFADHLRQLQTAIDHATQPRPEEPCPEKGARRTRRKKPSAPRGRPRENDPVADKMIWDAYEQLGCRTEAE